VIENTRNAAEEESVSGDLQKTVEFLVKVRPDLADPARLLLFKDALSRHIAAYNSKSELAAEQVNGEIVENEINRAKRITSIATAISGAVSVGLIAALSIPGASDLTILGASVIGLLGSPFAAAGIDKLTDKAQPRASRGC
jgi:hypothetical protein